MKEVGRRTSAEKRPAIDWPVLRPALFGMRRCLKNQTDRQTLNIWGAVVYGLNRHLSLFFCVSCFLTLRAC